MNDELPPQSLKQKKIIFANNPDMVEAALAILRDNMSQNPLVGQSEYETIVNAVTMDAQATVALKFINSIDAIKGGSLHEPI